MASRPPSGTRPEVLTLEDVEQPTPAPASAGQGAGGGAELPRRADGQGIYQEKPPLPFTRARALRRGRRDRPAGLGSPSGGPGAFAEYALMDAAAAWPVPDGMSDEKAAALYLTYQTGHVGLHRRAGLQAGEWRSCTPAPAASGRRPSSSARPPARRSSPPPAAPGKMEVCTRARRRPRHRLHPEDFVPVVKEVTGGHGADVDLRPGRRRRLRQVAQVHRLRGPAGRRRLHQRPDPRGAGQPPAGQELQRRRPALGAVPQLRPRAVRPGARGADPAGRAGRVDPLVGQSCRWTRRRRPWSRSPTAAPSARSSSSPEPSS